MPIVEHTLNLAIARVLDRQRRGWTVFGEETRVLKAAGKRPDIVVEQKGRPTVLIENEFTPAANVEKEARERLGLEFRDSGKKVEIAVALRSSGLLREADNRELDGLVGGEEFDYALFFGAKEISRFPPSGWLSGGLTDLADFVYRAAVPAKAVRDAAVSLQNAVQSAAKILEKAKDENPDVDGNIEKILQQERGEQTRRMAMTILVNALAFHDNVVGRGGVRPLAALGFLDGDGIRRSAILAEWKKILNVDFWPIFRVAQKILAELPESLAQEILDSVAETATNLAADRVLISHDLFGGVFQRLISDRKFLATFYTRPASAVLLANLAIPEDRPFPDGNWRDGAKDYVVADFACGTGALLSAAYRRVSELHERAGGDAKEIHPEMMAKSLVGCDVMPAAVHLTASILSGAHPNHAFKDTRLYTMPYGEPKEGEYKIGSLELLDPKPFLPVLSTSPAQERGGGEGDPEPREIPWRSANLVIMNPPFTRPTKSRRRAMGVEGVPNPAFAAFRAEKELQKALGDRCKKLHAKTCANGNAGLASDFVALADLMTCGGGVMAMVLPLSALAGEGWDKVRALWVDSYDDIRVVTLSAPEPGEYAFSADTSMGEVLFIGRQINGRDSNARLRRCRAVFIVLNKRPESEIEAAEVARIIRRATAGEIRKLEDGPVGGTELKAGDAVIGGMLDAPVSRSGKQPWGPARVRDLSLAQTAHALAKGRLRLPQNLEGAEDIPIAELSKFAKVGPISRDVGGEREDREVGQSGVPRGPFDIRFPCPPAATYPCLWAHDAKRETQMLIRPDSEGVIAAGAEARAGQVWKTAGRAHYSVECSYAAQPLAVAMTERPSIGGRAWISVCLGESECEDAFALWGNSTLGFLCNWWWSNKSQGGRGFISPARLPGMPTLNLAALNPAQLAAARKGFDALKNRPLLPLYRAAEDETRAELDRVILCEVLGLPKSVLSGVSLVREKLCAEPSVFGGKKSG